MSKLSQSEMKAAHRVAAALNEIIDDNYTEVVGDLAGSKMVDKILFPEDGKDDDFSIDFEDEVRRQLTKLLKK